MVILIFRASGKSNLYKTQFYWDKIFFNLKKEKEYQAIRKLCLKLGVLPQ